MSEYTPSLERLRDTYADLGISGNKVSQFEAEFDRAIAKVRAEAKVEALREAADDMRRNWPLHPLKPSHSKHVEDWLRARADNLVTDE